MLIDFDLSRPIYQQIVEEVKRAVARGDLRPGDKLPSHRDLARQSKVNPNTVQHAYRQMEQENLVETLRGQGTFIRDDPDLVRRVREEMASEAISRFVREMESLGCSPGEIGERVLRLLPDLEERKRALGSGRDHPGPPTSSASEGSSTTHRGDGKPD